jgi:hypothetical protein
MIDNKNEVPSGQLQKRWIGINEFEVLEMNPSKERREELKFNTQNFTGYVKDDLARVDVIIHSEEEKITTSLAFFLNNRKNVSSKEPFRSQWVDAFGNFTWATDQEIKNKDFKRKNTDFVTKEEVMVQYFFPEAKVTVNGTEQVVKARVAYVGEQQLTEFLKAWLALKATDQCQIPNIEGFFTGDFSGITEIRNTKTVLVPLGISEFETTDDQGNPVTRLSYKAYTRAFCDGYGKSISSTWKKDLTKDKKKIADIIQADTYNKINFGEYPYNWTEYLQTAEGTASLVNSAGELPKDDLPF